MEWSQKPSGHGGIRRALALIVILAWMAGGLVGLTSCDDYTGLGCTGTPQERWIVEPDSPRMAPGESKQFMLRYYQGGTPVPVRLECAWSASGGSVSPSGVFVAPGKPGDYTVTASYIGHDYSTKVTVVAATTQPGEPSPGSVAKAQGEKERIFDNGNGLGGRPGGRIPQFTIDRPRVIVEILTYHWDYNDHKLGTIALKNVETGKTFGPWDTVGGTGQGGVENAYWYARPSVEIPAGTYEIVDSSPSTWFTNDEAKGFGMANVDALK
jgi:hypothetical protein